jgi:hypothetical protein
LRSQAFRRTKLFRKAAAVVASSRGISGLKWRPKAKTAASWVPRAPSERRTPITWSISCSRSMGTGAVTSSQGIT